MLPQIFFKCIEVGRSQMHGKMSIYAQKCLKFIRQHLLLFLVMSLKKINAVQFHLVQHRDVITRA